jgi:catechol 2,3-dioxygenase-like lactoylglutathione lyase family enzyme
MKRFHVHVAVPDLQQSIRFYSTMFGIEPTVVKPDYAKWMLDDPRINFAISARGSAAGVNHLGFQVDDASELEEIHGRLQGAGAVTEEKNVSCCYARSDKYWVTDPAGVAWESFHSLGSVPLYHGDTNAADEAACCAPATTASGTAGKDKAGCCAASAAPQKATCCG